MAASDTPRADAAMQARGSYQELEALRALALSLERELAAVNAVHDGYAEVAEREIAALRRDHTSTFDRAERIERELAEARQALQSETVLLDLVAKERDMLAAKNAALREALTKIELRTSETDTRIVASRALQSESVKGNSQDAYNSLSRLHGEKFDLARSFRDTLCRFLDHAERRAKAGKPCYQDEIDAMTARLVEDTEKLYGPGRKVPPHSSGGGSKS